MADRNQHPLARTAPRWRLLAVAALAMAALVAAGCSPKQGASCWPAACPSDSPGAAPAPVIDAAPPATGLPGSQDLNKGPVLYYGLYGMTPEGKPIPGLQLPMEVSAVPPGIDVITPDGLQVPSPAFFTVHSPGALRIHFLPQATAMEFIIHANINHGATLRCWATQDGVPIPGVEDFDEDEAALGFGVLAVTCTVPNAGTA